MELSPLGRNESMPPLWTSQGVLAGQLNRRSRSAEMNLLRRLYTTPLQVRLARAEWMWYNVWAHAGVVQLVEHLLAKEKVMGSNPIARSVSAT